MANLIGNFLKSLLKLLKSFFNLNVGKKNHMNITTIDPGLSN